MKSTATRFATIASFVLLSFPCGCGGRSGGDSSPATIQVSWGNRTCPGPFAEGPYPAQNVVFANGVANVPMPPVFASDAEGASGWPRRELALVGTAEGAGLKLMACGVALEEIVRVTGKAPFAIERSLTWSGTRTEPCNTSPLPPSSSCNVVQRVVYPVDAP